MATPPQSFLDACAEQEIELSPEQQEKLCVFVEHVGVVNQQMNLTAARDSESIWLRHVFDSLLLLKVIKFDLDQRALDLGSGGGFPGIPLAICRPDIQWVLVDSVQKKAKFLEDTVALLGLKNVKVSSQRAEILGRDPEYREQFNLVTARAVARLRVLLEWTIPLLRVKGFLLAMKGAKAEEELVEAERAIERLFLRLRKQQAQPGGGTLLLFKKFAPTPGRYPRRVGVASSDPL